MIGPCLTDKEKEQLLSWYEENARSLPWRTKERDPYRVWVSEVMLQQTRVETVVPYFERFMKAFPTLQDLAEASEDEVLNLWEGLGFYARARNLHQAAKMVSEELGGALPENPEDLRELPGIGPSTAAGIASFAFNKPVPYLDGNIYRVIARYTGYTDNTKSAEGQEFIRETVRESMSRVSPGQFNESLIELGARICTPQSPVCPRCPLSENCIAHEKGIEESLPYTGESLDRPTRKRSAVVLQCDSDILMVKRPSTGLLGGMWELPARWQKESESPLQTASRTVSWATGRSDNRLTRVGRINHGYSHFKLDMTVFAITLEKKITGEDLWEHRWCSPTELDSIPVHNAARKALSLLDSPS